MKRPGVKAASTILVLLLTGYLAWCGRIFYLTPRLVFPGEMPSELREIAIRWHDDNDLPKPEPWSWRRFAAELRYPFRSGDPICRFATVSKGDTRGFMTTHDDLAYGIESAGEGGPIKETIVRGGLREPNGEIEVIVHGGAGASPDG